MAELSDRLETAVGQLVSGEDWAAVMAFAARFRSRSFGNTLLIFAQHQEAYEKGRVPDPVPSYVAGIKQWNTLGRHVIKGQPGYMIYAPVTRRFASTNPTDPESWRRLDRGEKPRPGETVRSKMVTVKPAYVWDVSQTTGEPIPERPRPLLLAGQAPAGLWDGLAAAVAERGYTLSDAPDALALGGANGVTDFVAHTVTVRADMDDAARVKTLAHELGHVALDHGDRGPQGLHRGIGEVEAESVALMVCTAFGLDSTGYTVPYVASWSSTVKDQNPIEVIRATGERVRGTALAILDRLPEPPGGDGTPPGLDRSSDQTGPERAAPKQAAERGADRVDRLPPPDRRVTTATEPGPTRAAAVGW
ncbi:serine/arginine repetitive matrix protein 2 [Calidifontibacter sp. DB0510]|uniref:Serine/arginine repetitive matrix protein 2 n=1 Tax=Metallococcus carri TaxID=1656884 RepID=A0A967B1M4_9MICO|nr:serine/arginine repetitive matrix protein 2 [Metallococcus carri]NOP38469.1 serine/arginine repetitive matrix protein 2 [Calidifontibacter sp. DB2511S]